MDFKLSFLSLFSFLSSFLWTDKFQNIYLGIAIKILSSSNNFFWDEVNRNFLNLQFEIYHYSFLSVLDLALRIVIKAKVEAMLGKKEFFTGVVSNNSL